MLLMPVDAYSLFFSWLFELVVFVVLLPGLASPFYQLLCILRGPLLSRLLSRHPDALVLGNALGLSLSPLYQLLHLFRSSLLL